MTRRNEFLHTHPSFYPGMTAFSHDGQELGEVQKLDEDNLTIEKGRFFSMDRRLPYDAVSDIRGNHLIINRSQADLKEWKMPDYSGLQESGLADIEEAQTSVPVVQKDLEDLESTEPAPTNQRTGPMPGGESFRDDEAEARKDIRSISDEDSGKIPIEDIELERDRIQKKE